MNQPPRVLLSTPISQHKEYILDSWIEHIKKLTWKNLDIVLMDNSDNPFFAQRKALQHNLEIGHIDKQGQPLRRIMAHCNEWARRFALDNGYDYLFILECDVFAPLDVIEQLMSRDVRVCAGMYFIEQFHRTEIMLQVPSQFQTTKTLSVDEGFLLADGSLKQVMNPGMGCILINRKVLDQFKFNVGDESEPGHADTFLGRDLMYKGIPVYVDTSVMCTHINQSWYYVTEQSQRKKKYNYGRQR